VHDLSNGNTIQDIDRRLWLELTPEQYGLVRELVRLESDAPVPGLDDETERVVEALARHFPGMGPAIRAVARHLIESGLIYEDGNPGDCCQESLLRRDERTI
jgi:hypothetical protein